MYEMILPTSSSAKVFVDQIFRIFDSDCNGFISFTVSLLLRIKMIYSHSHVSCSQEFMLATDMTTSGSADEKARWTFKMFDTDGSGAIEMEEMVEILETLYETAGFNKEAVVGRAGDLFASLDLNNDGELGEDEFVKACVEDKEILAVLNACGYR